jgi:hypothetical protein
MRKVDNEWSWKLRGLAWVNKFRPEENLVCYGMSLLQDWDPTTVYWATYWMRPRTTFQETKRSGNRDDIYTAYSVRGKWLQGLTPPHQHGTGKLQCRIGLLPIVQPLCSHQLDIVTLRLLQVLWNCICQMSYVGEKGEGQSPISPPLIRLLSVAW